MADTPSPGRRTPAMRPEQRRAIVVEAALPLLIECGATVSTAKIAHAADLGEDAIFRVVADKNALLAACGKTRPHVLGGVR